MHSSRLARLVIVLTALAFSGCASISNLSDSVSNSVSNSFESSSNSLSGSSGGDDSAYIDDVETLVFAYLETPATPDAFLRDLARVAAEHGITDWEANPNSLAAVGAGLYGAAASAEMRDAFVARYLQGVSGAAGTVRQAYEARRRTAA